MLAVALAVCAPLRAMAQACCGGSAALTPGRLAKHEDALVGVRAQVVDLPGSFDADRRFVGAPEGAGEVGLEQDLLAALRLHRRVQLLLSIPLVETFRRVPGASEAGGGLGDLQLGARYDITLADAPGLFPGVALLLAATFPTGRTVEEASGRLATDATGTGAFQGTMALALEREFDPAFVSLTGALGWSSPRSVGALRVQRGLELSVTAAAGVSSPSGASLALTASYTAELDARLNATAVPDSGRALTRLGLAGGLQVADDWRMQASLFGDPPLRYLGRNQPAAVGASLTLIRAW